MTSLLNVDWDYFFPYFLEFNWKEIEESFLSEEMIWPIRYSSKRKNRRIIARDYYNPVWFYKFFWNYVLKNSNPKMVFITDKTEKITNILSVINGADIYSFDQHKGTSKKIEEGLNHHNWAVIYKDNIGSFKRFNPRWNTEEFQIKGKLLGDFTEDFPDFELIFLSRNSVYTSSWNDDKWLDFVSRLKAKLSNNCFVYQEEYVSKIRYFDYEFATEWLSENQKLLARKLERKKLLWY